MRLLIFMIFFMSCTTIDKGSNKSVESIWSVIENASTHQWSKEKLTTKIGKPDQVFKNLNKGMPLAWIYKNKESGFQEWGVNFNDDGTAKSITYLPQASHSKDFTIDKILKRWESLNCKHKKEKIVKPHVIKEKTYISCDNGKRTINYNMYNEVESINVKR